MSRIIRRLDSDDNASDVENSSVHSEPVSEPVSKKPRKPLSSLNSQNSAARQKDNGSRSHAPAPVPPPFCQQNHVEDSSENQR